MPGLHISLGIFYRLFTLLETSCHQLDLELAQHASQEDTLHSYKLYSAAIHKLMGLEETLNTEREEADAAEQLVTYLAVRGMPHTQIDYCRQAASSLRKKIEAIVSKTHLLSKQKVSVHLTCAVIQIPRRLKSGKNNQWFARVSQLKKNPLSALWTRLFPHLTYRGKPIMGECS